MTGLQRAKLLPTWSRGRTPAARPFGGGITAEQVGGGNLHVDAKAGGVILSKGCVRPRQFVLVKFRLQPAADRFVNLFRTHALVNQ